MDSPDYWLVMPAAGRTVIEHALAPFLADPACRGIVVALALDDTRFATLPVARDPRVATVQGGAERRDSVAAGLAWLAARVVHQHPLSLIHI